MAAHPSDKELTLAYLRVAKRAGRVDELERITREPAVTYDPQAVLALLDEPSAPTAPAGDGAANVDTGGSAGPSWLADPRPVINVCDRHDLVEQMAGMLHKHGKYGHLKLYVQRISPAHAPQVTAGLLDRLTCT